MLIDLLQENPGQPPLKTRYRDPALLRNYGYQAIAIPHALAAIPAAFDDSTAANPAETEIDARVQAARAADLQVFFYADALVLPRVIVHRRPQDFLCEDNSNRLCPAKPAVLEALKDQIHELFDRWPAASGLIMRTGEVRTDAAPHMLGNPLTASNCEKCRSLSLLQRLVHFIRVMHDTVSTELQKLYVHRLWQPPSMGAMNFHDDPAAYTALSNQLPDSPRLAISFKLGKNDFRQGFKFNPNLTADARPKWIECPSEREHEGKGAFPNYQIPLWQEFLKQNTLQLRDGQLSLWGWSRGGSWRGPYATREEWIDANVFGLAELFRNPDADLLTLTTAWISRTFDIAESSPPAPALAELLLLSAPAIRKLLYVSHVPSYGDAPWIKDDFLDVASIWNSAMRAVDFDKAAPAKSEKLDALRDIHRIRQLFDMAAPDLPNRAQAKALAGSIDFFASFAGAVTHLFCGFAAFIQWSRTGRSDAALAAEAQQSLEQSQTYWQQNTRRDALLPGAPSVFEENAFWERTNDCLEQLQYALLTGARP